MISVLHTLLILSLLFAGLVAADQSTFRVKVTQPYEDTEQYRQDHARVQRTAKEVREQFDALQRDVDYARQNPSQPLPQSIVKSFGNNPNLVGIHNNLQKVKHMELNVAHMRKPDPDHGLARADMVNNVVTLDPKWHEHSADVRGAMLSHEATHIGARTSDWFLRVRNPSGGPDAFRPVNYGEARQRPDLKKDLYMGYHWFHAGRKTLLTEGSQYMHDNADSMSAGGLHAKYNTQENAYDRNIAANKHSQYRDPSGWHYLTGQTIPPVAMSPGGHGHAPLPPSPPKQSTSQLPHQSSGAGPSTGVGTSASHGVGTYGMTQTLGGHRRSNTLAFPSSHQRRPSFSGPLGPETHAPWPIPPQNPVRPLDHHAQRPSGLAPIPPFDPSRHGGPPVPPKTLARPTYGRIGTSTHRPSTSQTNSIPFPPPGGGRGTYGSHIMDLPPSPPAHPPTRLTRPARSSMTHDASHLVGPSTSTSHLPPHDPYRQRQTSTGGYHPHGDGSHTNPWGLATGHLRDSSRPPTSGPLRARVPSGPAPGRSSLDAPRPGPWGTSTLHRPSNAAETRTRHPSHEAPHPSHWDQLRQHVGPSNYAATRPRVPSGPVPQPHRINYVPAPLPGRVVPGPGPYAHLAPAPGPIPHFGHGPHAPVRPVIPTAPNPRLGRQRSHSLMNPATANHPHPHPQAHLHPGPAPIPHHATLHHGPGGAGPSTGPPPLAHPQGQPRPVKKSFASRVTSVLRFGKKKKDDKA